MRVQQLAEVGLAQPAVDPVADLDAHRVRHDRGAPDPAGEIDLAEAAFADQPFDPVAQPGLGADDDFSRGHEERARIHAVAGRSDGSGGGGGRMLRHTGEE
jgi:hypothetical protein